MFIGLVVHHTREGVTCHARTEFDGVFNQDACIYMSVIIVVVVGNPGITYYYIHSLYAACLLIEPLFVKCAAVHTCIGVDV